MFLNVVNQTISPILTSDVFVPRDRPESRRSVCLFRDLRLHLTYLIPVSAASAISLLRLPRRVSGGDST